MDHTKIDFNYKIISLFNIYIPTISIVVANSAAMIQAYAIVDDMVIKANNTVKKIITAYDDWLVVNPNIKFLLDIKYINYVLCYYK